MSNEVAEAQDTDTFDSAKGHYVTTGHDAEYGRFMYNNHIYPFENYAIAGIVWYQGESDASISEGMVYDIELCELIKVWRNDLYDNNLPFVVIQIADYDEKINDDGWRLVQEAQLRVEKMLPCVKTVISRDVCESDNIHPATKEILSLRVADALIKMR
jgi:sialate O-acetylesterase